MYIFNQEVDQIYEIEWNFNGKQIQAHKTTHSMLTHIWMRYAYVSVT